MTLIQLKYAVTVANSKSLNEASKNLFISQPSLTNAIHLLENEIGVEIFLRTKSGIKLTEEGKEFIGYAKQVLNQYDILDSKYISNKNFKIKFSVSTLHYAFVVETFMNIIKKYETSDFNFEILETKYLDVIENVKNQRSEIGIIHLTNHNQKLITNLLNQSELIFTPLMNCGVYVYMAKSNPLSSKRRINKKDLENFPCIIFDQGENNSFYLMEEIFNYSENKKIIKANDRSTVLNLMKEYDGYVLSAGIFTSDLNDQDFCSVKFSSDEIIQIGFIAKRDKILSNIGNEFINKISKHKSMR